MSENEHKEQREPRWGRILGVLALLMIVGLLLGHWIWGVGAGNRLEKQVAAYKAAGEPIEPGDFIVAGVTDADNAAIALTDAAKAIQKTSAYEAYAKLDAVEFPLRDDEIALLRTIRAENEKAFGHVETAMKRSGVDWKLALVSPVMQILMPQLNEQRELARLLAADALLAHHEGDDARAIERIEQLIFLARAVDRQSVLVSHLVAVGITGLATDRAAKIAPKLRVGGEEGAATREQVEKLVKRLLEEQPAREGMRWAMLGERMFQLDTSRAIISGRLGINQLGGPAGTPAPNLAGAVLGYAFRPAFNRDALLMIRQTTAVMNAAGTAQDYPAYQASVPPLPVNRGGMPWQNMLARVLMPSLDRAVQNDFRMLTDRRLTATALAMRLHELDHGGKRPTALSELMPKYLPAVPLDGLAAQGKPIGYVSDPDRPRVYSVGEDGVDDGGSVEPMKPQWTHPSEWQRKDYVIDLVRQPRPAPAVLDDGVGGLSTRPTPEDEAIPEHSNQAGP